MGALVAPTFAYLVVALVWSWPLPLHLANRFTHDPGDPLLVTYLIWWNAQAVPLTNAWWNAPFFYPLQNALAVTEHLAGLSPLTTPIQWLGGSPLLAYNLVLIASNWWSALATHALVKRLAGSVPAAACAAIAFTYAPYRTSQLGHLQLYASWWLPLILYALHRYLEDSRTRWLLLFGASWMFTALTNGYSLFFVPVLVTLWVAWFAPTVHRRAMAACIRIASAAAVFSLPLIPVLWKYYQVQSRLGLSRPRYEMIYYSGTWASFLSAAPQLAFWRHTPEPATTECYLFPGVTALTLLAIGLLLHPRTRTFWFYVAAAAFTALLALGPTATGLSLQSLWHPYDLFAWMPGFSGLRVPTRFYLMTVLCLAVAAGMSLAMLLSRVKRQSVLLAFVFTGLVVDGAIAGMPLGAPPGHADHIERGARLLALPIDDMAASINAMYRSIGSGMTVVNGYGGYVPATVFALGWALERRDATVLTELRRGHPLWVVVATSEDAPQWNAFIGSQPGVEDFGVSSGGRVFRLPAVPYARQLPHGQPLDDARVRAAGDALVAELPHARDVSGVQIVTNRALTRLPESVRVEVSGDGQSWTSVYDERPGASALLGALQDASAMPLKLEFPATRARYVRVNTPAFTPAALTIFGVP